MKPNIPIQAEMRWSIGFSRVAPNLPIFPLKEMRVKRTKKSAEKRREAAMKPGVASVGVVSSLGASPGRTLRSEDSSLGQNQTRRCRNIPYTGVIVGVVQLMGASLLGREHEPGTD